LSCPDWTTVSAWRRGDGAAPAGWQVCLDHLDGCAPCRSVVAELDPTLLLAVAAAPAPSVAEDDLDALKATVRSMVASERLAAYGRPDRRALLAAAALVALLAAPLGLSRFAGRAAGPIAPPEVATILSEPAAEPPIEEVQPAGARVYQFGTEDLPVVFIFDENLDL
jgi:hypothetical protein